MRKRETTALRTEIYKSHKDRLQLIATKYDVSLSELVREFIAYMFVNNIQNDYILKRKFKQRLPKNMGSKL